MKCLYCGQRLALLRKLADSEFCSPAHRKLFEEEQDRSALLRLIAAQKRYESVVGTPHGDPTRGADANKPKAPKAEPEGRESKAKKVNGRNGTAKSQPSNEESKTLVPIAARQPLTGPVKMRISVPPGDPMLALPEIRIPEAAGWGCNPPGNLGMGSLKPIPMSEEATPPDSRIISGVSNQLPGELPAAPVPVLPSLTSGNLKARLAPGRLQPLAASPAFLAPAALGAAGCKMLPPLSLVPVAPTLQLAHRAGMSESGRCLRLPSGEPCGWSRSVDAALPAEFMMSPARPAVPTRLGTGLALRGGAFGTRDSLDALYFLLSDPDARLAPAVPWAPFTPPASLKHDGLRGFDPGLGFTNLPAVVARLASHSLVACSGNTGSIAWNPGLAPLSFWSEVSDVAVRPLYPPEYDLALPVQSMVESLAAARMPASGLRTQMPELSLAACPVPLEGSPARNVVAANASRHEFEPYPAVVPAGPAGPGIMAALSAGLSADVHLATPDPEPTAHPEAAKVRRTPLLAIITDYSGTEVVKLADASFCLGEPVIRMKPRQLPLSVVIPRSEAAAPVIPAGILTALETPNQELRKLMAYPVSQAILDMCPLLSETLRRLEAGEPCFWESRPFKQRELIALAWEIRPWIPRLRSAVIPDKQAPLIPELAGMGATGTYSGGRLAQLWHSGPSDLKWMMLSVPAILALMAYSAISRHTDFNPLAGVQTAMRATPPAGQASSPAVSPDLGPAEPTPEPPGGTRSPAPLAVAVMPSRAEDTGFWSNMKQSILKRAAIELSDDFRAGLGDWDGAPNWSNSWSYDTAGFVRPGSLALYRPSLGLADYKIEFLAQIEKKSLAWAFRAADTNSYYAMKLTIQKPGPLPQVVVERYAVVKGREEPHQVTLLPMQLRTDSMYRVRVDIRGSEFTTHVQGQLADYWSDDRFRTGGVGFFSTRGEQSRVRWVEVQHQYDTLGRLCALLAPYSLPSTRDGSSKQ